MTWNEAMNRPNLRSRRDRVSASRLGNNRASRDRRDLEGPNRAPRVPGIDAGSRLGIEVGQAPVERGRAEDGGFGFEQPADGRLGPGKLEAVDDRPEVEAARPNDEGAPA